jgi:hypothetical protein
MLLKIDYDPKDVIMNEEGRLVVKVPYYSAIGLGASLFTCSGDTLEEFNKAINGKHSHLWVGHNGGLSLERT